MPKIITGDNTTPKELLRLIHELDPGAAVARKGDRYYLASDIRLVETCHELMELAFPVDADTRTPADAVRLWWDIAVTDLSRASYLAYGPAFYRFNPLGFWEQLTQQTVEALDAVHSTVSKEEYRLEMEEIAAVEAKFDAMRKRVQAPGYSGAEARTAGFKLGAVIGVIWAIWTRKH